MVLPEKPPRWVYLTHIMCSRVDEFFGKTPKSRHCWTGQGKKDRDGSRNRHEMKKGPHHFEHGLRYTGRSKNRHKLI